jgi:hypothetical protein
LPLLHEDKKAEFVLIGTLHRAGPRLTAIDLARYLDSLAPTVVFYEWPVGVGLPNLEDANQTLEDTAILALRELIGTMIPAQAVVFDRPGQNVPPATVKLPPAGPDSVPATSATPS